MHLKVMRHRKHGFLDGPSQAPVTSSVIEPKNVRFDPIATFTAYSLPVSPTHSFAPSGADAAAPVPGRSADSQHALMMAP